MSHKHEDADSEPLEGVVIRQESEGQASLKGVLALVSIVTTILAIVGLVYAMVQPAMNSIENVQLRIQQLETGVTDSNTKNEQVHSEFSKELATIKERFPKVTDDTEDLKELTQLYREDLIRQLEALRTEVTMKQDDMDEWMEWWWKTRPAESAIVSEKLRVLEKEVAEIQKCTEKLRAISILQEGLGH